MVTRVARVRFIIFLVPLIVLFAASLIFAEANYPETIAAFQTVYLDESKAQSSYAAFAKKALVEGYPNIALFFHALSISEGIHARNAGEILVKLGSKAKEEQFEPTVGTTRENLKTATSMEIDVIENIYPDFLKKIAPENHACAIQSLTHELETEKLHLGLLKKIQGGTGAFFGMLVKKFEGTAVDYFICHACGATTIELPKQFCPICKADAAEYTIVERNF